MDRNDLKSINRQQQRLVSRSPKQLKRASPNKKQSRLTQSENIDTISQGSKKWPIAGIVIAGFLVATAAGVGSQLKMLTRGKTAPQISPSTAVNSANPNGTVTVSPKQEQEGQMLLAQAKLLANQGQPQQLAQAIAITQRLPSGVSVSPEAQSLSATWSQNILESANTEASAGKIPEAIAIANLVPANTQKHQQAQQQIQQWQQQQAQAKQQQFAATLAEASRPIPLPPAVSVPPPPPITTTPIAVNSAPTPSVAPKPETQSQAQTQPQPTTSSAASSQLQAAQVKKPIDGGKQAQSLGNDPYLNVQIPQATVPQVQSKAVSSSAVALNSNSGFTSNSYGFRNLVANAPTVAIQLRDNVDEDGDFVSLIVNGKVYTSNQMIRNHGKVIMVDLQPGENKVEIDGIKDGNGGITLEVNVAGVGNINNTPIPEGSTASFIINRNQ